DEIVPEGEAEAPEALVARVQAWIDDDPSPTTADHLQKLVYQVEDGRPAEAAGALEELRELFSGTLTCGTAGIRGAMGSGPNRMTRAIVRRVGAAVAAWARSSSSRASEGVVIGRDARHG